MLTQNTMRRKKFHFAIVFINTKSLQNTFIGESENWFDFLQRTHIKSRSSCLGNKIQEVLQVVVWNFASHLFALLLILFKTSSCFYLLIRHQFCILIKQGWFANSSIANIVDVASIAFYESTIAETLALTNVEVVHFQFL